MKTFDQVRTSILQILRNHLKNEMDQLESKKTNELYGKIIEKNINDIENYISNIDEVTTIEIGFAVNFLIENIYTIYSRYMLDKKTIADIISLIMDKKYIGYSYFELLGIQQNDLKCFMQNNPLDYQTGDLFRQLVNQQMGTNIPMHGRVNAARLAWLNISKDDEQAKLEAFVHLKELERDAGMLKEDHLYYLLANDELYQHAKNRLFNGKKI